jgi:hypothetical protein
MQTQWACRAAPIGSDPPDLKPTMTVGTDPRRIRHYVFADGARLYVSGGDSGCGEPQGLLHTLTGDFCVEALEEAMLKFGRPEIFNTE